MQSNIELIRNISNLMTISYTRCHEICTNKSMSNIELIRNISNLMSSIFATLTCEVVCGMEILELNYMSGLHVGWKYLN